MVLGKWANPRCSAENGTGLARPSEMFNLENPLHCVFNEAIPHLSHRARYQFIDEFQYCKDISSVFKAVYDLNPQVKIYATGSSSMEIQAHLKESLAGRKLETILYPLSYGEWLSKESPRERPLLSSDITEVTGPDELRHPGRALANSCGMVHFRAFGICRMILRRENTYSGSTRPTSRKI
jgi:hypothetical protein